LKHKERLMMLGGRCQRTTSSEIGRGGWSRILARIRSSRLGFDVAVGNIIPYDQCGSVDSVDCRIVHNMKIKANPPTSAASESSLDPTGECSDLIPRPSRHALNILYRSSC